MSSLEKVNVHNMFLRQCSVSLLREDLEKLKHCYNKTCNSTRKSMLNTNAVEKKCNICKKVYTSDKKLRNHVENKHMIEYKRSKVLKRVSFSDQVIVHEFKEYHRCRKCPKIYDNYNSLKVHMKQMHKKRICYICFYCNKEFMDRMFFKVHIKMHCSLCGKFFKSKKTFSDHKRTVCRVIKKYVCSTCKEVYFSYLSLKDHSYEHEGVIFVCDICKERCKTKCTLVHHIQYLHCKKQPKTLYDTIDDGAGITYECNSCDHCSKNVKTMEDHTILLPDLKNSKRTGYKDYFFCDQCSEQFDDETTMLCHKWSHFFNTNHESQDQNKIKNNIEIKTKYKINEELPLFFKPKLVLDKLKIVPNVGPTKCLNLTSDKTITSNSLITNTDNVENKIISIDKGQNGKLTDYMPSKPIRKRSNNTEHQCKFCGKYLCNKASLQRHFTTKHMNKSDTIEQNLQCLVCKETFVWQSLLDSHECIRTHIPDILLHDARPDIQFDNSDNYLMDSRNTTETSDNINMVPHTSDISIPVEGFTEYDNLKLLVNNRDADYMTSKPIRKRSKMTLSTKHQCKFCGKYLCNKASLERHFTKMHMNKPDPIEQNLQCLVCEETFVWRSLLESHKCIRTHIPDMPFCDARPDIQFDNSDNYLMDSRNTTETSDNINMVPHTTDVSTPVGRFIEYDHLKLLSNNRGAVKLPNKENTETKGYRIVITEVPIEF